MLNLILINFKSYMAHMNPMKHIFQDVPLIFTYELSERHNNFCPTKKIDETHLLGFAQTLIYGARVIRNVRDTKKENQTLPFDSSKMILKNYRTLKLK